MGVPNLRMNDFFPLLPVHQLLQLLIELDPLHLLLSKGEKQIYDCPIAKSTYLA